MAILDKGWSNVTPNFSGSNKAMGNSIQALSNAGTLFDKLNNTLEQQQQNDINNALNFKKMALAEQENVRQQAEFDLTMKTNEESAQALEMMDALQTKYTRKDGSIDLQGFGVEATKLRQSLTTAGAEALATKFLTDAFARNDTVSDNKRADANVSQGWASLGLAREKFDYQKGQDKLKLSLEAYKAETDRADALRKASEAKKGKTTKLTTDNALDAAKGLNTSLGDDDIVVTWLGNDISASNRTQLVTKAAGMTKEGMLLEGLNKNSIGAALSSDVDTGWWSDMDRSAAVGWFDLMEGKYEATNPKAVAMVAQAIMDNGSMNKAQENFLKKSPQGRQILLNMLQNAQGIPNK